MNLPKINLPGYAVGYAVGYNDDDFERHTYSVKKTFYVSGLRYVMLYTRSKMMIHVMYEFKKGEYRNFAITSTMYQNIKLPFSEFVKLIFTP